MPAWRPWIRVSTSSGKPAVAAARRTAAATSSDVNGWPECALTTTGQPAARALAVSPPATLNASGKLLAENTPTTPTGTSMRRRSGRGAGIAVGSGWSMMISRYAPSASTSANSRSW